MGGGGAIRILSVRGIPIEIHVSWLLIYGLITWTLAVGYFPRVLPDLPPAAYWLSGLVAALLLFVSVLLHELSHSMVARGYGLGVRGITLHVFGGVSQLADEPPSPRAEFLIAAAGPLTSFVIAGVLRAVEIAMAQGTARVIVDYLVAVNLAVGVFNLIPGFPLDGGRLLRAILWRWKGALAPASYIASRVGTAFAFGLMALGVIEIFGGGLISGVWLILIGLFLRGAADASYTQVALRETLSQLRVRDVMTPAVVSVAPDRTLDELVEDFWTHHFSSFPVVDALGRLEGMVSIQQVAGTPREQWGAVRVRDVMRPIAADLVVTPGQDLYAALGAVSQNGFGRAAVVEGGRLVGYLSLKDITHALVLRGVAPPSLETAPHPTIRHAA